MVSSVVDAEVRAREFESRVPGVDRPVPGCGRSFSDLARSSGFAVPLCQPFEKCCGRYRLAEGWHERRGWETLYPGSEFGAQLGKNLTGNVGASHNSSNVLVDPRFRCA
jgi:hypothetical protein